MANRRSVSHIWPPPTTRHCGAASWRALAFRWLLPIVFTVPINSIVPRPHPPPRVSVQLASVPTNCISWTRWVATQCSPGCSRIGAEMQ